MGQFYQTTAPEFLSDKMFKLPAELMADVLMNKEKVVDADIAAAREFEKLKAQSLAADDPYTKQKLAEYAAETNAIVEGIKGNVMDYEKFNDRTRKLSNDVFKEWNTGGIARGEANLKIYNERVAALDEKAKKDPALYPPELVAAIKADAIRKFKEGGGTGYNKDTGTYNTIEVDDAIGLDNVSKILTENVGKNLKASGLEVQYDTNTGRWLQKTTKGTWEGVRPEVVRDASWKFLNSAPEIMSGLKQRQQYGVKGFEDPMAYLEAAVESTVATHSYMKEKDTTDKRENPYAFREEQWAEDARKEKEAEDFAIINISENLDTFTGNTVEQITSNNYRAAAQITKTKIEAAEVLKTLVGGDSKVYTENLKLIKDGNFVGLLEAGVPIETVTKLQNEYRTSNNKLLAIKGVQDAYLEENKGVLPMKNGKPDNEKFQNWLTKNKETFGDVNPVNQKSSWLYSGMNGKQQAFLTKAAMDALPGFKMDLGEDRTFETVDGRTVFFDPKNPKFKDGVTIQDLIDNKVLTEEQVKQEGEDIWSTYDEDVYTNDDTDYLPFTKKLVHKAGDVRTSLGPTRSFVYYKNGKPINVKIGANSLGLVNGVSNNGSSDIAFTLAIGKKNLVARTDTKNFSSRGINEALKASAPERDYQNTVNRMNKTIYKNVHGTGFTWDNKNGKIITPKNKTYPQESEQGQIYLKFMLGF